MSRKPDPTASTEWLDAHTGLSARQRSYVLAYLKDPNATGAAREAGYKHPNKHGPSLLVNRGVAAAIKEGRKRIEEAAMLDAVDVANMWASIATANVDALVTNRHCACRYCHGHDHDFQWRTRREFTEARDKAIYDLFGDDDVREAAKAGTIIDPRIPDDKGGYGYTTKADPDPDCPECDGDGIEIVSMADTSALTGAERLLYDGVEETRQGKKIRMQDRSKALDSLAKHLGMFAGKVESEETNPLTRLAARIMANASAVPVTTDDEDPAPDHDDEEIEP